MSKENLPLVSVCMITYAHEDFIEKAIEGVVSQQADFKFELVIGEDVGPDKTRDICIRYKEKYPDIIRLNLQPQNIGPQNNFMDTYNKCRGKYIALCEGDDFWIDPMKLQKQVDFMENNPGFSLCSHVSDVLEYGHMLNSEKPEKTELMIEDVISQNWGMMTASLFFRKADLVFPDWFDKIKNGDYAMQLLITLKGKAKILPEAMSVYRKHAGGLSISLRAFSQAAWVIYLLYEFNKCTSGKYRLDILKKIKQIYKNQISFAKEFGLKKEYVRLCVYRSLYCVNPFMIKNARK